MAGGADLLCSMSVCPLPHRRVHRERCAQRHDAPGRARRQGVHHAPVPAQPGGACGAAAVFVSPLRRARHSPLAAHVYTHGYVVANRRTPVAAWSPCLTLSSSRSPRRTWSAPRCPPSPRPWSRTCPPAPWTPRSTPSAPRSPPRCKRLSGAARDKRRQGGARAGGTVVCVSGGLPLGLACGRWWLTCRRRLAPGSGSLLPTRVW